MREEESAQTRARASARCNSAPHGPRPRQRQPCTLQAAQRAHWSWLCTKDPLYAHTPLHLHQCTLPPPPPPPPDNCWEKNKTPTPTFSNKVTVVRPRFFSCSVFFLVIFVSSFLPKREDVASNGGCGEEDGKGLLFQRQPRAPAVATAETCSIAGSFPRTGQNLSRGPEGRAGARSPLRTRRQPAPPRLQGLQKFSCCLGRAAKCVREEGGERPGKEQAGWLRVIRNLVQEERSGFFLCCLL